MSWVFDIWRNKKEEILHFEIQPVAVDKKLIIQLTTGQSVVGFLWTLGMP
jgi:hypothetical protein